MRSLVFAPWLVVLVAACCPAKPIVDSPPSEDSGAPVASASAKPSAAPVASVAPDPVPVGFAAPTKCALWSLDEASDSERALFRWSKVGATETLLRYTRALEGLATDFPEGYTFFAVTPEGALRLARTALRESERVDESGEKQRVTQLVLGGDAARTGQLALFLPEVCVTPTSKLRALDPLPAKAVASALKRAGKLLALNLSGDMTTVAKAALPRGATLVVSYYRPGDGGGYPESAAFTMKDDGTVVDVLLLGETPDHAGPIPYAIDLDGDGVEELIHVQHQWEAPDQVHVIGWQDGKPKSARVDEITL